MDVICNVAAGVLRFLTAIAIGALLLFVAICLLAITGDPLRIQGFVFVFSIPVIAALALRYAMAGEATRFDRGAASLIAILTAAGLAGTSAIAWLMLVGALMLGALFLIGGAAGTASAVAGPVVVFSFLAICAAGAGTIALVFLMHSLWAGR